MTTLCWVSHAWATIDSAMGKERSRGYFFLIRLGSTVLISCDTVYQMPSVSIIAQSAEKVKPPSLSTIQWSVEDVDAWAEDPLIVAPL